MNEGEESSVKGAAETGNTQHSFTASTRDMGTHSLTPSCIAMEPETNTGSGTEQKRSLEPSSLLCESLGHTFFCAFSFFPWQKQHHGGDCSFFPISEVRCLLHMGRRAYGPLCLFLSQDSFWLGKLHTAC